MIVDLDPDDKQTIVGRSKRDSMWLMARTPTIPDADHQAAMTGTGVLGYDPSRMRRVPQSVNAE
ncbi:MAG: lipocalin family protein [Stenotrophomonas maltophilia]